MDWRDIPGYEGRYQASDQGDVKSLSRKVRSGNHYALRRERILKQYNIKGYMTVRLYDGNRHAKTIGVHRLVAWAFIGKQEGGMVCCHNDGNPLNNNLCNIRYDTVKGNHHDKYRHGTHSVGEKNPNARLTEEDVRFIRYKNKHLSYSDLARIFGVTINAIYWAKNGITWPHVTEDGL